MGMSFLRASAARQHHCEETISRGGRQARAKHCLLQMSAVCTAKMKQSTMWQRSDTASCQTRQNVLRDCKRQAALNQIFDLLLCKTFTSTCSKHASSDFNRQSRHKPVTPGAYAQQLSHCIRHLAALRVMAQYMELQRTQHFHGRCMVAESEVHGPT